ncbi:hypothetical protein TR13x_02305 [Caloranaerobacter sp. TR13]|uniref:hypothetical protein n=1 Tax=Caloranaerobacter sp. TR13 TaxID=1302151 RepID=UPI0006D3B215|nr:hypothetical protein [Caloranaerobacter sp. TR13]KPU28189.1 hypothetical protein TR13x_02305 [Caloranaerobacter sp. TR13]
MTSILLICLGIVLIILSLIVWIKNEKKFEYFNEVEYRNSEILDYTKYFEQKIDEFEQMIFDLEEKIKEIHDYIKLENIGKIQVVDKVLTDNNLSNEVIKNNDFKNWEDIDLVNEVQKLKYDGFRNIEIAKKLNRSIREVDMILKLKKLNK